MRSASIAVILSLASGCGGGSSAPDAARLDVPLTPTTCTDPLHTDLTAVQTGVSADAYDCEILAAATAHGLAAYNMYVAASGYTAHPYPR